MKKLIILLGIVLFCAAASASVTGINILSQEHHVSGYAYGTSVNDSYDETETFSVIESASALWWGTESYTEENPGTTEVSSSAGDFSVTAEDRSCCIWTGSWAVADSTYTFSPLTANLQFQYAGSVDMHEFENKVSVSIYDITASQSVDYREWTTEIGISFNENTNYILDPGHQYELQLYAEVSIGDTPDVTSSLEVSIVPEPCTLALLGFGGLILRRRKA
jgi:hypothetical protein